MKYTNKIRNEVDLCMKIFEVRECERGISLIALVITIIVIIILAAIAFNSSTSTIGKANYSKFVSNISEVEQSINEKMVEVKGAMLAKGSQITDGQAFNYVAKGGKTDEDFVVESRTPDYTIIEKSADIGIKLPVMKVNTPTKTNVEVKYAVTKNGKIFIWPPFPSENAYNIRDKEFVDSSLVSSSGDIDITVAGTIFKLQVDGNSKVENRELLDDGLSKKEFEEIKNKIKVGDYVNYVPTAVQNVETDVTKTGYTKEILSTDATAKWRILNIDESTGKIMLTTDGYVNKVTLKGATGYLYGANELHRLCQSLYSNADKGITARSMTIEDLDKACGYTPPTDLLRYAWYPADTPDADLKDVVAGGHTYTAMKHSASLIGEIKYPRFYNWDDKNGVTHQSTNEKDYIELKSKDEPVLITQTMYWYDPSSVNAIIGDILKGDDMNRGWLASPYVDLSYEYAIAYYGLRTTYASCVVTGNPVYSTGYVNLPSYGLRPLIQLSAKSLDINNISTDGTSSKAWNIK